MSRVRTLSCLLASLLVGAPTAMVFADDAPTWIFLTNGLVDSTGIHLDQVLGVQAASPPPHARLAVAPPFGQTISLSRRQVADLVAQTAPDLLTTNWAGANTVRISRRARLLAETDLRDLLAGALQQQSVKDKGELELRLNRVWTPISVPDEPLTLKILDLPASGVSANFFVRFELLCGPERIGSFQISAQARVFREVLVAQSPLKRGQLLRQADVTPERRDLLATRDALPPAALQEEGLELNDVVAAGMPVPSRAVRARPLFGRGSLLTGLIQNGAMQISLKVEALEDGLAGQSIRVRNPKTRREFVGKVQDEQTVLLPL